MKLYFKESVSILKKTFPFVLLKVLIYLILIIIFFLFASLMLFIAFKFSGIIKVGIIIVGLLITWGFAKIIKRYLLYLVKVGHIAVISSALQGKDIGTTTTMFRIGFDKVRANFATSSVFFAIDAMIHGVVSGITKSIGRTTTRYGGESARKSEGILSRILSIFFGYIDEAIISYIFIHPSKDPWKGAKEGLILYFKVWKNMLITSVLIVLLDYGFTFVIFYGLHISTSSITAMLPYFLKDIPFIIAISLALFIKWGILDQFTLVWMITTYQRSIVGLKPELSIIDKITEFVPGFKELINKTGKNDTTKSS